MFTASISIGKDPHVDCVYGKNCLESAYCRDLVELLYKQLTSFSSDSRTSILTPFKVSNRLKLKTHHFDASGYDEKGNSFHIYSFFRRLPNRIGCNTVININHPDAEKIRDAILATLEKQDLKKKGYIVEHS